MDAGMLCPQLKFAVMSINMMIDRLLLYLWLMSVKPDGNKTTEIKKMLLKSEISLI